MGAPLFCGVDGGTGDTEAVLVDERGATRGRGHSGPSNDPAAVGRMHPLVGEHMVEAISAALLDAAAAASDIHAVSLNLSGDPKVLTHAQAVAWLAPLQLADDTHIAVDEDGLSAWAAADFPDPVIWILLGTNCGSQGIRNGRRFVHPLAHLDIDAHHGRAVGGAIIGTWGLGLAIRSRLGGEPTALFDAFEAALRVDGLDGLEHWAATHTTSDDRAELFRVVTRVAADGDAVADRLLRQAGSDLALATQTLALRMGVGVEQAVTLVLAGKAWRAGGALVDEFRTTGCDVLPMARLHFNQVSQAHGAALLAMHHAGLKPGPEVFGALQTSAGEDDRSQSS
jgi:N-acetylglucosamine kinase-like BadF-type ATPase